MIISNKSIFSIKGCDERVIALFLCKGVDKMQYTLLGFGLTLTVLLGIEALRERV